MFCCEYISPLGSIWLASNKEYLTNLWFAGQRHAPQVTGTAPTPLPQPMHLAIQWLEQYFNGRNPTPSTIPIAPNGSEFQKKVWQELLRIPYGETISYKTLSERIDCKSAQAIGGAVGRNPISLIIPCHRVIAHDGTLGGYAAGTDLKRQLLENEHIKYLLTPNS